MLILGKIEQDENVSKFEKSSHIFEPSSLDRRNAAICANVANETHMPANYRASFKDISLDHSIQTYEVAYMANPCYVLYEADKGSTLIIAFQSPHTLDDVMKVHPNKLTGTI